MPTRRSWDIFCTVVDNYGDIGVCWRLARQLVQEHGLQVRLWVDRLEAFQRIAPAIDPEQDTQQHAGVKIRRWRDPFPPVAPHEVVIEAFACHLPPAFVQAMAAMPVPPVWINLEYLSAEDWVAEHHSLASPHPTLPLVKHFYFPGFGLDTGGLLMEQGLLEQRAAFQGDPAATAAFWRDLGLPVPKNEELRLSLFAYENSAVVELLDAWAAHPGPVSCLVPEGRVLPQVAAFFGQGALAPGQSATLGALTVHVLPFLPQEHYDHLLWACDFNFVRGEDSFVRAQWAARPFVWHIYPQNDEAHWTKLNAFLAIYSAQLAPDTADALAGLWRAWNHQSGMAAAWRNYLPHAQALTAHARQWAKQLGGQPDLASGLVQFCEKPL
jgi:uncharacterized repeat protein (TIGR03837 family)